MRSSNSRSVLHKQEAQSSVLSYEPIKFDFGAPQEALKYLNEKSKGSEFRLSDPVKEHTGIRVIEEQNESDRVESAALEKVKLIQEEAYAKAFEVGLEEGRVQAYTQLAKEIDEKLLAFSELTDSIKNLKPELVQMNEASLMQLVFHIASRIAKKSVSEDPMPLVEIIREAVGMAQADETILCLVNPSQIQFLETLQKETSRNLDFLKQIRFEGNTEISVGGCVLQTNYGEIDARIEQRIESLWNSFSSSLPKIKIEVAS